MSDLYTRLRAAIQEKLALAKAATPGPWSTPGPDTIAEWSIYADKRGWMVATAEVNSYPDSPALKLRGGVTGEEANRNAAFIAAHDPADAIRRHEAALELLDWLVGALVVTVTDDYNLDVATAMIHLAAAYGVPVDTEEAG